MSKESLERELILAAEFDAVVDALILMVDNYPNDADLGGEMRILFNKIRKDGND